MGQYLRFEQTNTLSRHTDEKWVGERALVRGCGLFCGALPPTHAESEGAAQEVPTGRRATAFLWAHRCFVQNKSKQQEYSQMALSIFLCLLNWGVSKVGTAFVRQQGNLSREPYAVVVGPAAKWQTNTERNNSSQKA